MRASPWSKSSCLFLTTYIFHSHIQPNIKWSLNVKLCKLLGRVTLFILWSSKLLGNVALSMLWLKSLPKVKLCELLGRVIMCVTTHGASMLLLKRLPKVKLVKLSHQSFYYLAVVAKATAPFDVYCLAFGSSLAKRGMCSCLSRQLLIIYPNMR